MVRMIAALLLVIPGIFAAYGIKLMRDSLFNEVNHILINTGIQFIIGMLLFVMGIWFIGGFIVHRDRKRQLAKEKKRV
ncbi:DUF2627 domain-containing protein [Lentibacillus saliphilus]|uniref:DUF2627 domain-containing protein n=1 Tax=Lentibacillus saliphilus TaxID=2737028 RepID=UPI001C2F5025|nr:DUF2627 domain-containing protein [Lentibacillus saliphilus]